MTAATRKALKQMLSDAWAYRDSLIGTRDGRDGVRLDIECARDIARFKACVAQLEAESAQLAEARTIIRAYLGTVGLRPKKDIIKVDDAARAWLEKK